MLSLVCRTSKYIQELVGSIDTSSALAAYERMEEKVMRLEAEAEALGDITEDNLATKVSFWAFELSKFEVRVFMEDGSQKEGGMTSRNVY